MDMLEKGRRRSGFTFAPEAATDRLRDVINKPIATDELLDTAEEVYSRGWTTIKMYFMIGHPTQTLEDVQAIADLAQAGADGRPQELGRKVQRAHRRQHAGAEAAHALPVGADGGRGAPSASRSSCCERQLRGPGIDFPGTTRAKRWSRPPSPGATGGWATSSSAPGSWAPSSKAGAISSSRLAQAFADSAWT